MLLSLLRYIKGYLRIRIIGYSPERFLNLCSHHHIYIWGLKPSGQHYEMYVTVAGFRKLKPIIKKTKTRVVIVKRYGLPFFLHKYRKRKMFFAGAAGCVFSIYLMSCFVWNIHIEGNYTRTDEVILEYLRETDVYHGMKKSDINCERIVKNLRKKFNDIIWVSATMEGTRLLIHIKENADAVQGAETNPDEKATDLIASADGTIVKIMTRTGAPLVEIGDHVKKGDLLVSGRTEILNDAKEIVEYRYQAADADVYIQTVMPYEYKIPLHYEKKVYSGREKHSFYICSKHYKVESLKLRHSYKHFEELTSEEQLAFGEHFYFPISYGKRTIKEYSLEEKKRTMKEAQEILSGEFQTFCSNLEKKGVEIVEKNVRIYNESQFAVAKGSILLIQKAEERTDTERIPINDKKENSEGVY